MVAEFALIAWIAVAQLSSVTPALETEPVETLEDAADDAALWVHPNNPAASLILGTDKRAGLRLYDLSGEEVQFLPVGRVNNVDLIQSVTLDDWSGDLAAASNRTDDSITLFAMSADGAGVIGSFSVAPEPYGFCMGRDGADVILFVAHKQGYVQPFKLFALGEPPIALPPIYFRTQIEGCVYDAIGRHLYVGEETRGIWQVPFERGRFGNNDLTLVDATDGDTDLAVDVEGLTLYRSGERAWLIASSQGDDTFHAYHLPGLGFAGKFAITADAERGIDGAQETDGIHAASSALPGYPKGLLIVQDGFNVDHGIDGDGRTADDEPLAAQNFKLVDWQSIEALLEPGD